MNVKVALKIRSDTELKRPLVQILVVVANIQMRSLKSEAGKVSTWTVIDCGLAGPKENRNWENSVNGFEPYDDSEREYS